MAPAELEATRAGSGPAPTRGEALEQAPAVLDETREPDRSSTTPSGTFPSTVPSPVPTTPSSPTASTPASPEAP
jgi:hypothetical protein